MRIFFVLMLFFNTAVAFDVPTVDVGEEDVVVSLKGRLIARGPIKVFEHDILLVVQWKGLDPIGMAQMDKNGSDLLRCVQKFVKRELAVEVDPDPDPEAFIPSKEDVRGRDYSLFVVADKLNALEPLKDLGTLTCCFISEARSLKK